MTGSDRHSNDTSSPVPDPVDELTVFDDPQTDRAVEDIVARESDELLAAQDAEQIGMAAAQPPGFWRRFGRGLAWPWRNKVARYSIVLFLCGSAAAVAAVPAARYYALNAYGATVSSTVLVTDDATRQPLKNVTVRMAHMAGRTGADGRVTLRGLRLGPTTLIIERPGFDTYTRPITLGWGSNPLGPIALQGVGVRYVFLIKDFLTNKAVAGAAVTAGDATAVADSQGKAVLTLPNIDRTDITAEVGGEGYRPETVHATLSSEPVSVMLAVTRKAVFVSKERGTYDVYSSDIDGRHKRLLLAGTGSENANMSLTVSPDGSRAALVSVRGNHRDSGGSLVPTLTLIDIADGSTVTVSHATQIRLLDWVGSRLVFEQVTEENSKNKHTILGYDYAANTRVQLAAATQFNGVLSVQGAVYYASSAGSGSDAAAPGLFRISMDGSNRQTVLDKEVWTVYRTDYNTLSVQTSEGWYAIRLSGGIEQIQAPAAFVSRSYIEGSTSIGKSLWVDIRGGQGVLQLYNRQNGQDMVIHKQAGLTNPLRWLTDDIIVYRLVTGNETADYAVSALGGGTPHKIADVVSTYGFATGQ